VVAEGVETGEQLERLKALECEYAQGYWFSEPVADTEAAQLLFGEGRAKSGVLAD
jgi:EAL domain-containing protein (putative c-di-GMP-specific phosphodiesterase class I)